jgi:hypothetical protein
LAVIAHIAAAVLAVFCLAFALEGQARRALGWPVRGLLGACGIALFAYDWRVQAVAATLAAAAVLLTWRPTGAPTRVPE